MLPGLSAAERDELSRLRRENRQLRVERDILSKPRPGLPGKPARCRRALPVHDTNQARFPIATMARVLGVSKAGSTRGGSDRRPATRWPMRLC